ncbi:MAG: protein rep [Clostridia bacterium]|nr:protein rep [Clostridia bacterium]
MDTRVFSPEKVYNDGILDYVTSAEYYKRKSNQLSVIFENSSLLHDYGSKLYACGSFLGFAWDADASRVTLSRSNFCRVRFCPMCQWRRSRRLAVDLADLWADLISDGYDFLHVVLTVKNTGADDLKDTIDGMQKAYRNMLHDPALIAWKGALRFLEVTYSEGSDTYHPHFHSLVIVRKSYYHSRHYVSTDALRELWKKYLRSDYLPQCYISKADTHAINEVAKYCVKPFDLECDDWKTERKVYETLYFALHGRRLFQAFGHVRIHRQQAENGLAASADPADGPTDGQARICDLSYDYRSRVYRPLASESFSAS